MKVMFKNQLYNFRLPSTEVKVCRLWLSVLNSSFVFCAAHKSPLQLPKSLNYECYHTRTMCILNQFDLVNDNDDDE